MDRNELDAALAERVFQEHAGAVRAFAAVRVGADEADDVVAETFAVAWRRLEDLPAEPRPWLLGVARRVMANGARGRRRQDDLVARIARVSRPDPDAEKERVDLSPLSALSVSDQELLLATAWFDLDRHSGAAVFDCTPATFAVRLHRARRRARALLAAPSRPVTPAEEHR